VEGLSYRFNGGVDFLAHDMGSYWGRDTEPGLSNQGRSVTEARRSFEWTIENIVRYHREIGRHSVDVTGLYGAQGYDRELNSLTASGFPNDVLTYHQSNVALALAPETNIQEWKLLSQMGRLNYGYDGRYLLTLTARRDGFSGFGENYKYGLFPSVAGAWNVSEESFWPAGDAFSSMKLRASYGQNGNHAIQPYQTLARLGELSYLSGGSTTWPGFIPASLANPNLRWETTTSLNLGMDFGFFAERLFGALDLYSSETDDLLLERLVSPVHGIPRMVENVGVVQNRGIELALSGIPLETADFSWKTDFNIAANRNRILDLYGDRTDDVGNQWFIGQPIRVHYGWVFDGVWQESDDIANSHQPTARPGEARVRDVNGDGRITADDRTFLGTEDPSYTAGLSNTLSYGNLSLSVFFHAVQGVMRYAFDLLGEPNGEQVRRNGLYMEFWSPENPVNTKWANRQDSNPYRVGLQDDASFIRLKDLTMSYDLPASIVGRVGAGSLRLYANARNLWTHTNWSLTDPEISPRPGSGPVTPTGTGSTLAAHPNDRVVPMERTFSIGISARF
jgi:TonB-linked SusC/RagA family outer membrane protein